MEVIATTTDVAVTLVWCGFIVLVACAAGALGERFLMRNERKRGHS